MKFGAIIIGDEILSGKRQDKHMSKLIEVLSTRGLELSWGHYLGDDPALITATIKRTLTLADVAFSFGGIGATPDDHTRQCAADAAGVGLTLHPDAEAEIRARFVDDPKGVTPQRLAMGEFPAGAQIIPNPVNRIPGFSLGEHYFVPGFPQMAWPMAEWVLETRYRDRFDSQKWGEASILVFQAGESQLIPAMKSVEAAFPAIKVFSLPSMGPAGERIHVELGVRGSPSQVDAAMQALRRAVADAGFPYK